VASALDTKFAAVSCAPFGVPVEPEVGTTKAISESISCPARWEFFSNVDLVGSSAGTGSKEYRPAIAISKSGRIASGSAGRPGKGGGPVKRFKSLVRNGWNPRVDVGGWTKNKRDY